MKGHFKLNMKNNKKIKAIVMVVSVLLIITGCSCVGKNVYFSTGLSKKEVFKIKGSSCKLPEAMITLTTQKNLYVKSYGNEIWSKDIAGVTFEEYVKNNVKDELAEMKTMNLLAKEKKVKLTEQEEQTVKSIANEYYSALTEAEKDYMKIDLDTVTDVYTQYFIVDKIYEELTKEIKPEISDADAKVIKVQSIYAKTYIMDQEEKRIDFTEEEKIKVKSNMENILKEVNDGGDFTTIAANNTDANEVEYQFGKGDMIIEFEETAFNMSAGQISGIIDTSDGYYIIKCISDYMEDETQNHKQQMIQEKKDQAFLEIYNPFIKNLSSEFNDDLWDSIKFSEMEDIKVSNFYELMDK